jgi:hypothetical protein
MVDKMESLKAVS